MNGCCTLRLATAVMLGFYLVPTAPHAAGPAVAELTAEQIAFDLAAGKYTVETLTRAYLDRIARHEARLNAMTILNPAAVDDARAIDRRIAAGERVGLLAGIPVVVKESIDVAGLASTLGWKRLNATDGGIALVAGEDATVVRRLRDAGAIILGKTNMPAFAGDDTRADSSWAGPSYNAVDPDIAPGASSAGTATAVAASFAVMGLAEETGGSIQNPAAAQSLVGVKPSFALVPNSGVAPIASSTRDVVGVHAKTVYDAAMLLQTIAGYSLDDPKTVAAIGRVPTEGYIAALSPGALRGKRIGLYGPGWRRTPLSDETLELYGRAVTELSAQGAVIVRDPFAGSDFAEIATLHLGIADLRGAETAIFDLDAYFARFPEDAPIHSFKDLVAKTGEDPFGPGGPLNILSPMLPRGSNGEALRPDITEFLAARERYLRVFDRTMAQYSLDGMVFPQMLEEPPRMKGNGRHQATTVGEINVAGLPAVIVPAGAYRSGAPFSLIFVGPIWSESLLLSMAYAYELQGHHRILPRLTE